MTVTVTKQTELDNAIRSGARDIIIHSSKGVWLEVGGSATVRAYDSATVRAYDSATVSAYGSATVRAYDSATVSAYDSATVSAYDSATVRAYDSATVSAYDSATVRAYDSATVRAYHSATVRAGTCVAVHVHNERVKIKGGVVIDMTAINETDPKVWCDLHGVTVKRNKATLYKAVDDTYTAGQAYLPTTYAVGTIVTASDFRPGNSCGGGLHLSPTPEQSTAYRPDAVRWVACEVKVADIHPIPGDVAKCKVRSCRVVAEVDAFGRELAS